MAAEKMVASQRVKEGFFDMLKGGVIMDVMSPEQARVAEEAGGWRENVACARKWGVSECVVLLSRRCCRDGIGTSAS